MLRQIAHAIPAIRHLSIWAINVNASVFVPENDLAQGPPQALANQSNQGFFSKFSTSLRSSNSSSSTSPLKDKTVKISQLRRVNEAKDKDSAGPKVTGPKVLIGYFRDEDVQSFLDGCSDERAAAAGTKAKGLDESSSSERALQDVIEEAPWAFGLPKGPLYTQKKSVDEEEDQDEEDDDDAGSRSATSKIVNFLHAEVVR